LGFAFPSSALSFLELVLDFPLLFELSEQDELLPEIKFSSALLCEFLLTLGLLIELRLHSFDIKILIGQLSVSPEAITHVALLRGA